MKSFKIITEKETICLEIEVKVMVLKIGILKLAFNHQKNCKEFLYNNIKKLKTLLLQLIHFNSSKMFNGRHQVKIKKIS